MSGAPSSAKKTRQRGAKGLAAAAAAISALLFTSCANPALEAYYSTSVLGPTRQIVHHPSGEALHFNYRGGTVIYRPFVGSKWLSKRSPSTSSEFSDSVTRNLPNGCLVYACARAEQIRLQPRNGESKSQVIGFSRATGGGHAFVIYEKGGRLIGEDNLGFRGKLPRYRNRSPSEALRLARTFQALSGRPGVPVQAWFLGSF
jgi:hypothetical protein